MVMWLLASFVLLGQQDEAPRFRAEQIFPPNQRQTHAPGIVECPNGDLLASWYGDSGGPGENNDGAVYGARWLEETDSAWSEPFVMADRPGFPDGNTTMMVDNEDRLWLFWPTILAGSWESCLMNYKASSDYAKPWIPNWDREGVILLKPAPFRDEVLKALDGRELRPPRGAKGGPAEQRAKLDDPLYQRLGWAPRCKPTILPSGRILLPLYSDTFSISIMAISDDKGTTWYASKPLAGGGNIQPTVLRRDDGTLVAYMREAGPRACIRVSESKDDGITWGPVGDTTLPNPGSGIDGVRLKNGHWLLVYNDSKSDRAKLAASISEDEGKTWKWTRHLESHRAGRYHYPAVIQGRDGTIHAIYSCFMAAEGPPAKGKAETFVAKGIKHAAFDEAWVRAGD